MLRNWESARRTARHPECLEIVFCIDDDDADSIAMFEKMKSRQVKAVIGPRSEVQYAGNLWNKAYEASCGEIFMLNADDIVFRTKGWDVKIGEAFEKFPDRIVYVYARDGYADKNFGTHGFLHRRWTETVGYFVHPESVLSDLWLMDVARMINRFYFVSSVYTEHLHPIIVKSFAQRVIKGLVRRLFPGKFESIQHIFFKARQDDTYHERLALMESGQHEHYKSMEPIRKQDAEKLCEAIRSHKHGGKEIQ